MNVCDNWVVLKMEGPQDTLYKLLVGTSGGYLSGDSWRMNSGITECKVNVDGMYEFYGYSGSIYLCNPKSYTLRHNNSYIYNSLKEKFGDKVLLMDDIDDWTEFDWNLENG